MKILRNTLDYQSPRMGGYRHWGTSVEIIDGGKIKLITYYVLDDGRWGTEIYSGPNYVKPFDSREKSYSRNYLRWRKLPKKYLEVATFLKNAYKKRWK